MKDDLDIPEMNLSNLKAKPNPYIKMIKECGGCMVNGKFVPYKERRSNSKETESKA